MGHRRFTQEFRDEAVQMVVTSGRPIEAVARDLGVNEGTLGNWVAIYRRDHPASQELNINEREKLIRLERENRDLRLACLFYTSRCV